MSVIAAALGVSAATVSNALSGKGRVSPELADKVRTKAAELGYVPSLTARALRTGRSGVLGLVLPDIGNPLFPQIAQAIENAAATAGFGVLIADSRGDNAMQTLAIQRLMERQVDGIVIVPRFGTRIADLGCPVAVIDSPSTPGNTVSSDHWQGGQLVADHLVQLGHRDVVLIGANPQSNVQNDRIGGIRSRLPKDARVEVLWIEKIEAASGAGCPLGLAERVEGGFTAFAASNDLHALRAVTELQRAGICIPERATVVGFDDLAWSSVVSPSITSVRQDMATIAEIAVSALLGIIDDENPDVPAAGGLAVAPRDRVPMTLVARQTSGPPRKLQHAGE
jgi:LacI family transcriptional regulator